MHELIESINAVFYEDDRDIEISITDTSGDVQSQRSSVTKSGTFRFSYKHPEDNKKHSYQGILHSDSKLMIFPIVGIAVISDKQIDYETKHT